MEEFLARYIVRCICFFGELKWLWLIGNRISCCPILSVITQIGLLLGGRPILLITRMITDYIGLRSFLISNITRCTMSIAVYFFSFFNYRHFFVQCMFGQFILKPALGLTQVFFPFLPSSSTYSNVRKPLWKTKRGL